MPRKKSKKKFYLTLLVIFLVFSLTFNILLVKAKKMIDNNLFPAQSQVFNMVFSLKRLKDFPKIMKENENLKFENMKLKEKVFSLENMEKENKRLTSFLEIKERNQYQKDIKIARVIYKNIHNLYNKFHINLGEKDGIEQNMIVVYDNCLIGRVAEVFENRSMVELITNPKTMVSVKTESGMLGISQGSDNEDGKIYFEPSTFEEGINEKEVIYTSGISNIYPEGLKIGKITKIIKNQNYLFKNIEAEPEYKIRDLREVIVYKYSDEKNIKSEDKE